MSILGGNVASTLVEGAPSIVQALSGTPAIPTTPAAGKLSAGTALLNEKIQAGREILKLMHEQQQQNIELAKQFAEFAKASMPIASKG